MALLSRLGAWRLWSCAASIETVAPLALLAREGAAAAQLGAAGSAQQLYSTAAAQQRPAQNAKSPSLWLRHTLQSGGCSSSVPQSWRGISSSAASGSQCDCPTLGGPTPDTVTVEYDEDEVDRFIALADAIEEAFPNVVVEGNPSGPGRPGAFEVVGADGNLLFSRLSSGSWPEAESVVDAMAMASSCAVQQQ